MRDVESAVGGAIARARRARAMTQSALALASSLDRTALAKIETGRRRVSSGELGRVARALGVPVGSLLERDPLPDVRLTLAMLRRRRRTILEVTARHGARSVLVFGSVARGEATADSDVDLLVEMEPERSLLDRAAMIVDLQKLLGRDVDVVTVNSVRDRMRDRILREAIPL